MLSINSRAGKRRYALATALIPNLRAVTLAALASVKKPSELTAFNLRGSYNGALIRFGVRLINVRILNAFAFSQRVSA